MLYGAVGRYRERLLSHPSLAEGVNRIKVVDVLMSEFNHPLHEVHEGVQVPCIGKQAFDGVYCGNDGFFDA